MRARDVMNRDVVAVERIETVEALMKILHSCNHNAFPVLHHQRKHFIGTAHSELQWEIHRRQAR